MNWLRTALKRALEGNGYRIVSSSDPSAQFKLKLNLTRLWVEDTSTGGGWAITTKAEIQADVEISKTSQEMRAAKFVVNASGSHLVVIVGRWGIYDALPQAFEEFIQKLVTHPELVAITYSNK